MMPSVILFAVLFVLTGIMHSPTVKAHDSDRHSAVGELHAILEIATVTQLLIIVNKLY
ncbi:MAG: hypothetical protein LBS14_00405 [Holosporaceae bacterium]|jgi:hypothetical protein|nr:hypothetical protein [Holosporaceae bacterium]